MFSHPEKNISQFHIDPGMSVADFGSGSGFYSLALAEAVGKSGKVYSIDIQKDLLSRLKNEAVKRGLNNIVMIWGDLDHERGSQLKDASVDRVVVANTFFQIENKENFIQEVRRVLKPNGKVLFIDWTDSFGGIGPHANEVIKPDVARTIFEEAGFQFDRDISAGEHHYGMVFKMSALPDL